MVLVVEVQLGGRIRALRKRAGLTLRQVGEALDMTPQGVSAWERGSAQVPSATLPQLAEVLGVEVADLFREPEAEPFTPTLADEATALLVRGWKDLPESEQQFILDFVESRRKLRERSLPVNQPEHTGN